MTRFGLRSIRFKILWTVLATSLCALFVAGVALIYNDAREYRRAMASEIATQADLLGQASASALEFNDPKFATDNLALLRARPDILAAALYTPSGKLFARYVRAGGSPQVFPTLPGLDGITEAGDSLVLFRRITGEREILGTVYLRVRNDLPQRLLDYVGILGAVLAVSLLVGLLLAWRLQTYVTKPILAVGEVAKQVMETRDFSLRAAKVSDDEIGYLAGVFNDMLAELGRRADAIEAGRQSLEHEIAERRGIQRALQTSERRNRSLVEAGSQVVWVSDEKGCFVEPQASWSSYTGQTDTTYRGVGWRTAFATLDRAALDRAWAIAISEPKSFELELGLWHRASERYRQVLLRAVPLFDHGGKMAEWIGTITDMDDRRAAEHAVRQLNAELERRVAERTAQLEEVNHDLESFSYSVSHDLRAPVRAIGGFSAMLEQHLGERIGDEGHRLLGVVRSEASRMGTLIDDLLSFSRLGRQAIQPSMLDMRRLAEHTFQQLTQALHGAKPQLQLGSLPQCRGDRTLIGQVWVNLLSNAIKFSSKRGQAVIEVGAISDDEKHTFYVRDNGVGFEPAYKAKLFSVFQRLHDAREYPGTGVGLALVARIVNRHGGQVWADSKPGEGATFYFTIPREPQDGRV